MSVLSNFEGKVEGAVDGAAAAVFSSPIEPAQIAKKAEKQMKKEKLVGSGRQYAPTLYNVLVNERDDRRLFGFYPTMAAEIENYLYAKGTEAGMEFDTRPLVRFIADPGLKKSRFDVIAEVIAAPIIKKLRAEEMEYYGLAPKGSAAAASEPPAQAVEQPRASSAYASAGSSASPQSSKFAGLDRPAQIDDALGAAQLPPLSQNAEPLSQLPGLSAGMAGGAASSADEAGSRALGNASLFNTFERRSYPLTNRKLTAGRGKENEIVVADANASRVHTRFSQDATGKWKLLDLDSTNGTLLNGRPVTSAILKHGDEITIGTTVLQFKE